MLGTRSCGPYCRHRPFQDAVRLRVIDGCAYVGLLILTMQRRQEVAEMDWSEIDLEAKTWILPPERAKNDEAYVVPLSPLALDQLDTSKNPRL
jgi:integrase